MKTLINKLPKNIHLEITSKCNSFCDVNCSLGYSLPIIEKEWMNKEYIGIDFVEYVIEEAKKRFPQYKFMTEFKDNYDLTITSNSLEHISNWEEVLENYLAHTNKYCLILVPFHELIDIDPKGEHINSFNLDSFPDKIGKAVKIHTGIFKCPYWQGEQMLVIYEVR
jgi:hypothetical protein